MNWIPTKTSLFFSKQDRADVRLGDFAMACNPTSMSENNYDLALWGYGDDEGISLNGGRPGAASAPQKIRSVFYKTTPHVLFPRQAKLADFGDVNTKLSLNERHQAGLALALSATAKNKPWISLGGGHDYGYADGAGFLQALQNVSSVKKPVILNFDAHLDVRPSKDIWHSGTPFYRLLSEFGSSFHFIEIGLQPQCNSRAHWDWALTQGAQLLPLTIIEEEGLLKVLSQVLSPFEGHPLWVSFDIDSLRSSEAPGCSQSWTTGLETKEVLKAFYWLAHHLDWKALSIYEVSPPLDVDLITVRTAALLMHQFASLSFLRQGTPLLGVQT